MTMWSAGQKNLLIDRISASYEKICRVFRSNW